MNLTELVAALETYEKKEASQEEFLAAAENVKKITVMTQEQQLLLYSLYKQATVGDCNTDKPGFFEITASRKWSAWKSFEGLSADKARVGYIFVVEGFLRDAGL